MLSICNRLWADGETRPLDEGWRERIQSANDRMAGNGMRVLGVGLLWLDDPAELEERDLVFLGLVAMIDPPRPEVSEAVQTCFGAGIRPIMITGDHPLTTRFIAYELGISKQAKVVTGLDLARMEPEQLVWVGVVIGGLALGVGLWYHQPGDVAGGRWQTMIFTSLAFLQIGQALASRSSTASCFALGFRSNKPLLLLVLLTVALQLTVLYVPFFDLFFNIVPLSALDLLICVLLGVLLFAAIETEKWFSR